MKADANIHDSTSQRQNPRSERPLALLLVGTLSAIIASCSQAPASLQSELAQTAVNPAAPLPQTSADSTAESTAAQNTVASAELKAGKTAPAARSRPQLIKRAQVTIVVESIDKTMRTVSAIVQKQQGDLLGFQDTQPPNNSIRHTASMQIRVPSPKLETTLDDLATLGTLQSRSLTAEDVSTQLVDFQARMKNLRKSEEAVLKIMDRSGSVGEVLKVSQELGNIRESIERIDAQLKDLRNQVAYSTITLNLEAAVAAAPPSEEPFSLRIQETWGQATHSVSTLTLNLLSLSIWLFAFSPYLIAAGIAWYAFHRFKQQKLHASDRNK